MLVGPFQFHVRMPSKQEHNTTIRREDNASITTTRGDVVIETQSAPLVDVRAFTSTYGLVGLGRSTGSGQYHQNRSRHL